MKISELPKFPKANGTIMLPGTDRGGSGSVTVEQIIRATIEAIRSDVELQDQIDDNVWVQCREKSEPSTPYVLRPHKWATTGDKWIVDGVVLYHNGRLMLIAPDEVSLPLASGSLSTVRERITDQYGASMDLDGKGNTEELLKNAACESDTVAPGYCAAYSHGGQAAGKWWLPSVGEVLAMYANVEKINCAMGLIGGTELHFEKEPLSTSTMTDLSHYWRVRFNEWPNFHGWGTVATSAVVRPVSAFGL